MVEEDKKLIDDNVLELHELEEMRRIEEEQFQLNSTRSVDDDNGRVCHPISLNILDLSQFSSSTISGVSITKNTDNSISLYGTSSSSIYVDIPINLYLRNNVQYTHSKISSYIGNSFSLSLRSYNKSVIVNSSLDSRQVSTTFTVPEDTIVYYYRLYIPSGVTLDNTFFPIVVVGNEVLSYEPYEGCLYGLDLYDTIESNFITDNYYINCCIIALFLALIIILVNAPFIFIRKLKGN